MADATNSAVPFLETALKLPDAHHSMGCVASAWTQLAQGLTSAGLAQMELARALLTVAPSDWAPTQPQGSADVAHQWLKSAAVRFDTTISSYRRINDDLTASLFAAADSFLEATVPPEKPAVAPPRTGGSKSG